jgi:hypothetical protein
VNEPPLSAAVIVGSCGQAFSSTSSQTGSPVATVATFSWAGGTSTSLAVLRPDAQLVVDATNDPGSRPD